MKKLLLLTLLLLLPVFCYSKVSIAIIGDSITAGLGVDVNDTFPVLLKNHYNNEKIETIIYNFSSWGASSTAAKDFASNFILNKKFHFDIIIFCIGINDALNHFSSDILYNNMNYLIRLALKENLSVVLGAIYLHNYDQTKTQNYAYENYFNTAYFNLISNNPNIKHFTFLDMNILNDKCTIDGIHPNAKGHQKIYENLYKCLNL